MHFPLKSVHSVVRVKNRSNGMFKKEAIFVTFRVWLYEKQLGSIRGYPSLD